MPSAADEPVGAPDREAFAQGFRRVCGLDEVGRGPLAGPVVAAAVVFAGPVAIDGLTDSKKLSPRARAALVPAIRATAVAVGVGAASPTEIDRLNILQASLLAMVRAVEALGVAPDCLLVDGLHRVSLPIPQRTLVRGDLRSTAVAAASVVAKEHRDAVMLEYARSFPGYAFETHKGYPTREHREALRRLGPSPIHRASFKGVRELSAPPRQPTLFPSREHP